MEFTNKNSVFIALDLILAALIIWMIALLGSYSYHIRFADTQKLSAAKEIELYSLVYPYDNKIINGSDITELMVKYTTTFDYMIYFKNNSGSFPLQNGIEKYTLINEDYTSTHAHTFSVAHLIGDKMGTTGLFENTAWDDFTALAVTDKEAKVAREEGLDKLALAYHSRGLDQQTTELPTTFVFIQGNFWEE